MFHSTCNSKWLLRPPSMNARLRVFCFPYAGASATAYSSWQNALGSNIDVCAIQLPGRGARFNEPNMASLSNLIHALAELIQHYSDKPFVFFGHSLGAVLAFELTRHLRRYRHREPDHLFVSGSVAPGRHHFNKRLHELDDDALIQALERYNGTPPEALKNRELMMLLLPAIRADFALLADYRYQTESPLNIPLTVLAGEADPYASVENIEPWREETMFYKSHWFRGDHFFIHSEREAVISVVREALK